MLSKSVAAPATLCPASRSGAPGAGFRVSASAVGASLAPYAATWLASHYGLQAVGAYLTVAALLTVLALIGMGRIRTEGEV